MSTDGPEDLTGLLALLRGPREALTQKARTQLTASEIRENQRWRILGATVIAVGERGYWGTTIADVCTTAKVSKKAFYQHFSGKEDAVLASYEACDIVIAVVRGNLDTSTMDRFVDQLVGSYLGLLEQAPAVTRLMLFQSFSATPAILERRLSSVARYTTALHAALNDARTAGLPVAEVPRAELDAMLGGIHELCIRHIHQHGFGTLITLRPALSRFVGRVLRDHR